MTYPTSLDATSLFFIVFVEHQVTAIDHVLVLDSIAQLAQTSILPILLDFRSLNAPISDVLEWVLFVERIREAHPSRVALLHTSVGQSTSCHLIALWANRDNDCVQAFHDRQLACRWLLAS